MTVKWWIFVFSGFVSLYAVAACAGVNPAAILVPPARIMAQGIDPAVILVDTRPASVFAAFHIPGAINVPLEFLTAKRFLATRTVVLVNNGFRRSSLLLARRRMLAAGFGRVVILDGGIAAWLRNGGAIDGDRLAAADATILVTPEDLYNNLPRSDLIAVDVSGTMAADEFSGHLRLEKMNISPAKTLRFHDAVKALAGEGREKKILLITERGGGYPGVTAPLADLKTPVFFLKGGIRAWDGFRLRLAASAGKKKIAGERRCPVCPR